MLRKFSLRIEPAASEVNGERSDHCATEASRFLPVACNAEPATHYVYWTSRENNLEPIDVFKTTVKINWSYKYIYIGLFASFPKLVFMSMTRRQGKQYKFNVNRQ